MLLYIAKFQFTVNSHKIGNTVISTIYINLISYIYKQKGVNDSSLLPLFFSLIFLFSLVNVNPKNSDKSNDFNKVIKERVPRRIAKKLSSSRSRRCPLNRISRGERRADHSPYFPLRERTNLISFYEFSFILRI